MGENAATIALPVGYRVSNAWMQRRTSEKLGLLDATGVEPAFDLRRSTWLWRSVLVANEQREAISIAALPLAVTRTSHAAVLLILFLGGQSVATD